MQPRRRLRGKLSPPQHEAVDESPYLVAPDAVGCAAAVLWPLVSGAVIVAVWLSTPRASPAWILAAVVLAPLWLIQAFFAETMASLAAALDRRVNPGGRRGATRVVLENEEGIRCVVLPPVIGSVIAAVVAHSSPLLPILAAVGVSIAFFALTAFDQPPSPDAP